MVGVDEVALGELREVGEAEVVEPLVEVISVVFVVVQLQGSDRV